MDKVQYVIKIAFQIGSVQEFCEFVETIHNVAKCTDSHCPTEVFNRKLNKTVFDENITYDDRRNFFLNVCKQNINLFWSIYKLQQRKFFWFR